MLKACLQPEPAKRLTALEILALPYFDEMYTLLEGTELQHEYDAAYAAASDAKAPSALSLWTVSSACIRKRVGSCIPHDAAKGFNHVGPAGSSKGGLGRSQSTAMEYFSEAQGTAASKGDDINVPLAASDSATPRPKKQLQWGANVLAGGGGQACQAAARKLHRETMNGSSLGIDRQAGSSNPSTPRQPGGSELATVAASATQVRQAIRHRPGPRVEISNGGAIAVEPRAASETNLAAFSGRGQLVSPAYIFLRTTIGLRVLLLCMAAPVRQCGPSGMRVIGALLPDENPRVISCRGPTLNYAPCFSHASA